jgi:hypothetical protein
MRAALDRCHLFEQLCMKNELALRNPILFGSVRLCTRLDAIAPDLAFDSLGTGARSPLVESILASQPIGASFEN